MSATAPRILTLVFPRPPAELSPNARGDWPKKYRATSAYRRVVWGTALAQTKNSRPLLSPVHLFLHLAACGHGREMDLDNLVASFKSGIDGLRDAGIIPNDSPAHVRGITPSAAHCPPRCKCGGALTVTVEEVQP